MPGVDKSKRDLDKLYGRIAERYDLLNTLMSFGFDRMVRHEAYKCLTRPGHILDIATGSGVSARALRQALPQATIIAIDRSPEMLAVARRGGGGEFLRADACSLPFADGSFDAVSAGFVFRPLGGSRELIAEVYRVLKPGGRAVVYDTLRPPSGFAGLMYQAMLRAYIPLCGLLFAEKLSPYLFYADSIQESISGTELAERFRGIGFNPVETKPMLLGAITILIADKPDSAD